MERIVQIKVLEFIRLGSGQIRALKFVFMHPDRPELHVAVHQGVKIVSGAFRKKNRVFQYIHGMDVLRCLPILKDAADSIGGTPNRFSRF